MNEPLELLKKANQESNEQRIKLNTLTACFKNLAQGFHAVCKFNDKEHDTVGWLECSHPVCKSNNEVLVRLKL